MLANLWLVSIVISIIITIIFAFKFKVKRVPQLTVLNILCPFAGFAYAFYVVHVIVPKVVKQETGQDIESPVQPIIDHYLDQIKERVSTLLGSNNNNDRTL